jgi:hypothetical protein
MVVKRIITVESDWNRQKTEQRLGRGRRRGGHEKLVIVERLVLIKPPLTERFPDDNRSKSADEMLEELTELKQKKILPFLERLREIDIFHSAPIVVSE